MAMTGAEKSARFRAKRGAEIEQLRTENETMRAQLETLKLRAENEALRAELESVTAPATSRS